MKSVLIATRWELWFYYWARRSTLSYLDFIGFLISELIFLVCFQLVQRIPAPRIRTHMMLHSSTQLLRCSWIRIPGEAPRRVAIISRDLDLEVIRNYAISDHLSRSNFIIVTLARLAVLVPVWVSWFWISVHIPFCPPINVNLWFRSSVNYSDTIVWELVLCSIEIFCYKLKRRYR